MINGNRESCISKDWVDLMALDAHLGGMVTSFMLVLAEHLGGQPDLLHYSRDSGLTMHITLGLEAVN